MKTTLENNTLTLFLEGRIDSGNAAAVEEELLAIVGDNPGATVSIDAEKLEYISSAGLRVLVIMCKTCSEGVTLVSPNELVREIIGQTGFASVLTIA